LAVLANVLPSISSTLYACFFRTKNNCATFSSYVLALAKDFGAKNTLSYEKRVCITLIKLTPLWDILVFAIFGRQTCVFVLDKPKLNIWYDRKKYRFLTIGRKWFRISASADIDIKALIWFFFIHWFLHTIVEWIICWKDKKTWIWFSHFCFKYGPTLLKMKRIGKTKEKNLKTLERIKIAATDRGAKNGLNQFSHKTHWIGWKREREPFSKKNQKLL